MTHPIDILERLARECEPAPETRRLIADLPTALREAVLSRDAGTLSRLLSGRTSMACMVSLPDNDSPLPDDDQPAQPEDEPQDGSERASRVA